MKKIVLLILVTLLTNLANAQRWYESDWKRYFAKDLLSHDPIEGIYNRKVTIKQYSYGDGRHLRTDNGKGMQEVIVKDPKSDRYVVYIIEDGEYFPYNHFKKLGNGYYSFTHSGTGYDETFKFNGADIQLSHEMSYDEKRVMSNGPGEYDYTVVRMFISEQWIKTYPTQSMYQEAIENIARQEAEYENAVKKQIIEDANSEWTGTGFALKDGYVVTNFHVIDGAKSILVKGVKGDFNTGLMAYVVATDTHNDIALLKIKDSRFKGFGNIPYKLKTQMADVGEDVFVLGYPMTYSMGEEVKLTNGIISARSGFEGNVALYQMTAAVQPGNSGGPLFDSKGNVIGIVNAKHTGAENAGYAIKASNLKNLIESSIESNIIPVNNTISTLPLSAKVKAVKNFVFFINCSKNGVKIYSDNAIVKNNPSVGNISNHIRIKKVVLDYDATEVVFEAIENGYDWISINRQSYLFYKGNKYMLKSANGIKYSPEKTMMTGGNREFSLIFEPLPMTASSFDFSEGNNGWFANNIRTQD